MLRVIADLQPGELVVAEKTDHISRLPLAEAEQLVGSIRSKGARLAVAAVDRIIHHATIIEIEGDSYRRKKSLKN